MKLTSHPDMIETHLKNEQNKDQKTLRIPCKKCGKSYKIQVPLNITEEVDHFPFPLILMHSADDADGEKIHTMLAYIDKNLKCRHVDFLKGKRVYITPYIVYNPSLLQVYCKK